MDTNYLFIAVLILFIYMIGRGYKKGFLQIVISFAGVIVILAAVKKISPYVSEYLIENTDTYQVVQEKITDKFAEANLKYDNSIPENQNLTIDTYDIPDVLKDNLIINNTQEMYRQLLVDLFEEYVSAYLAKTAINALSFVAMFVLLYASFKVLLVIVDIVSKIPIINGINRLLGALLGTIESLLVVWVFFIILVMFIGEETAAPLYAMIGRSSFLTYLFNSNILLAIIS